MEGATGQAEASSILTVKFDGLISSTTVELLNEALAYATKGDRVIVILLDTPGGSLDATFKIVDMIERSEVPIIGYVYPPGARSWSAGTFILMATHVAAMAPNTIIGSCQPVVFDPLSGGSTPITDAKQINAISKYMAERARTHSRDASVATRFVTENLNLNDEEALTNHVIEYRAENFEALIEKVNGLVVSVAGRDVKLNTFGHSIEEWSPSPRVRFLGVVSDPFLAYLLFVVGFIALISGLSTPGAGAEIFGGLTLTLGLVGLGVFGINTAGIVFMFLGMGLLIVEYFQPGFGVFGASGIICFTIGSVLLFPHEWTVQAEWLNILYALLIVVPMSAGLILVFVLYKVLRLRRSKPIQFGVIGKEGKAQDDILPEQVGHTLVEGELWAARSSQYIKAGSKVRVIGKDGPVLIVEPLKEG